MRRFAPKAFSHRADLRDGLMGWLADFCSGNLWPKRRASVAKFSRYVITSIIAAEAIGWLVLLGLRHFYSVSMTSQYGLAVPLALLTVGGATAGLIA